MASVTFNCRLRSYLKLSSIDSCTLHLHSWRPFVDSTTTTTSSHGGIVYPHHQLYHTMKRPCRSDRATSLLPIDSIDLSRLSLMDDYKPIATVSNNNNKSSRSKLRLLDKKRRRRKREGEDKELGFTNTAVAGLGTDEGFKKSLPTKFLAPAAFWCIRVAIKNGEAEVGYQATVNISGHVLKGFLYNKGVDEKSLFPKVPLESGKSRTSRDSASPIVNPRDGILSQPDRR
ncbi:hypothetical protein ACFE04_026980 [Oxalis oulophora]